MAHDSDHQRVASFHLVQERSVRGVGGMPRERRGWQPSGRGPAPIEGLVHARVLGAGRDGRVHRSFDPGRRAVVAIWRDDAAVDTFLETHPVAERWSRAGETWHVTLRLVHGHGRWGGRPILDGLAAAAGDVGPAVVLTRASIRLRSIHRFDRAASSLQADLGRADGLRAVVGVGDVPIVRLGTVSVWESVDAARRASGAWAAHAAARDAAVGEGWFAESLFATFAPIRSWGTWSGRDPLAPQHA